MPRKPLLFDISQIDLAGTVAGKDVIHEKNLQRYEFDLVDRIVYAHDATRTGIACKHIAVDDWWTRGHIPGRPLFPGVLMIETAAQTACCLIKMLMPELKFIGFLGADETKFRGQVVPPGDFFVLAKILDFRRRIFTCACQGLYHDEVVFESKITGMEI